MSPSHFDPLLTELRHYHYALDRAPVQEDSFRLATDLGLSPAAAMLLRLQQRWSQLRQKVPSPPEPLARAARRELLLALAHEALLALLLEDEELPGPRRTRRTCRTRRTAAVDRSPRPFTDHGSRRA